MPQSRDPRPKSQEVLAAEERARRDPAFAAAFRDAHRRSGSTPESVRATNQGFTFNYMDELDAGSAGKETDLRNWLADRGVGTRAPYDGRAAHDAVLVTEREAYERAPAWKNVTLGWVGGAANPIVRRAGAVIKAQPTAVSKGLSSALINGGFSAANGAGSGKTPEERRSKGFAEGAVGAVVGGMQPSFEAYVVKPVATRLAPVADELKRKVADSKLARAVVENEFGRRVRDVTADTWDAVTRPEAVIRPLAQALKPDLSKGVDVLKALFDHGDEEERRNRR